MNSTTGTLYVVATPIGNLEDISARALRVLRSVDLVLAEDTRVSAPLLHHYGIATPLAPLHAHNERQRSRQCLAMLRAGRSLAIISDAGTPLISDPGFILVCAAKDNDVPVVPVPGPSAPIAALSVSGLPCDRFVFEGFLPANASQRRRRLEDLRTEERTMIFFEAPHRIAETLEDFAAVFGARRRACLAREISKVFETITTRSLGELAQWVEKDPNQRRGEIVLCVQGAEAIKGELAEGTRVARILCKYFPPAQAASIASELTSANRKQIYRQLTAGAEGAARDA